MTRTGPDGRLALPRRADPFLIVVLTDAGIADATSDEFAKTGKLDLQPWGRIEGEVRIGRNAAAYQAIVDLPQKPADRNDAAFLGSYDYHLAADAQGRFAAAVRLPAFWSRLWETEAIEPSGACRSRST